MKVDNRLDARLALIATAGSGGSFLLSGTILFLFSNDGGEQPLVFTRAELALVASFIVSAALLLSYSAQPEWAKLATLGFSSVIHAAIAGYALNAFQVSLPQVAMVSAEGLVALLCGIGMWSRITDNAPSDMEMRKIDRLSETVFDERPSPAPASNAALAVFRKTRLRLPMPIRLAAFRAVQKLI